jgi:hypothetical protein
VAFFCTGAERTATGADLRAVVALGLRDGAGAVLDREALVVFEDFAMMLRALRPKRVARVASGYHLFEQKNSGLENSSGRVAMQGG